MTLCLLCDWKQQKQDLPIKVNQVSRPHLILLHCFWSLSRQMQFTDELSRALASTVCHTHIHARWQYRCGNRSAMSNIWSISALAEQLVCGRLIRKGGTLGTETLIRHQLCMKIGTLHRSQGWLCFSFPTLFIQMQDRWMCNSSGNPFFPQTHSIF